MVGRDNRTTAAHGGDGVRRQTADSVTIQAKHGGRRGHSSTQPLHSRELQGGNVCLDAGSPGETGSGPEAYPGCTG